MKKLLSRLLWIPLFAIIVLFLVANRQLVAVSLDPFNAANPAVTTPAMFLWVWLILIFFVGFSVGAFGMWVSGRLRRQQARMERRELKATRKEMKALKQKVAEFETAPPAPADAALPLLKSSSA